MIEENTHEPQIGNRMGFIETIDDTLTLYRGLLEPDYVSDLSFEEKMLMREAVEKIKRADLYFMGEEFEDILGDYYSQFDDVDYPNMRFSEFARPCSRICYIRLNHFTKILNEQKVDISESTANFAFITEYFEDKTTSILCASPLSAPTYIGTYHPDNGIFFPKGLPEEQHEPFTNVIVRIAGAFELINNPKFVVSEKAGTRAQRKQMKREQDICLEAWHKITWNVDKSTVALNDNDRGGWRMPLHYTRGHPRKAEPHHKNVMYKNGKPYKWIHGFWSGHPAYGIKKGYHAPTTNKAA